MNGTIITGLMFLACALLAGVYSLYCLAQEKKYRENCTYVTGVVTGHEKTDSRIRLRVNFMEGEESVTALTQPEHIKIIDTPEGTQVPLSYQKIPDREHPGQMKYEMYLEEKRLIQKSSKPYIVLGKVCCVFCFLTVLMAFYYLNGI